MKLYNANFSPNCLRVRAVANELGIDLEIVELNVMSGEHKTPVFAALNANLKVPVLEDGDFCLWESRAISAYLASLKPESGLYPNEPRARAEVDQWSYWQAIHLGPAMQKVAFERFMKPKFGMGETDESAITAQLNDVAQFLDVLNTGLDGRDWIAGHLSVADFALASTFMYREPANMPLEKLPHVADWIARLETRPSWQEAVEPLNALMKG